MTSKSSEHIYNTLGKITASLIVASSVLVIVTSLFTKKQRVSYERLRQAYDGLSPRDYQE